MTDATDRLRAARIAAAEPLRARARRRTTIVLATVAGLLVLAVVLAGFLVAATVRHHTATDRADTNADVLAAADSAVATLLTADPQNPEEYVRRAIAATTGEQRERLADNWLPIAAEIRAQGAPSTGEVLASGLVVDPPSEDVGATSTVLLVAEATNPELLGGAPDDRRITVQATMTRTDAGWRLSQAGLT
ncbi:hypothetical protein AAFP30_17075 [Gordonia sp. CPCC 205515]|uniref:hypothetical protein n=1 Tax=Gordonia sp. CPCC 205515 TaxID=3140791 RepID=UPI003AF3808C